MNKLTISYIIAIAILASGFLISKKLGTKKEKEIVTIEKEIANVYVDKVLNTIQAITLESNGSLVAKNKINISSEVQGVFESSSHLFKPGVAFKKGDVLLKINSQEFRANLQVQKSNLYQKLISILPDLKLDYPSEFDKWQKYITDFDINRNVSQLPSFDNQQEKLFITGRGIPTSYYTVKNLEERLSKYTIYAPFYGILTQANVDKGTLINPGQALGTLINPSVYELEVSISTTDAKFVKVGRSIDLFSLDKTQEWKGKITRINPIVDPRSQSILFYVQVTGKDLKEGMYLKTNIKTKNETPVFEINRSLLIENNKLYGVTQDNKLAIQDVKVVYLNEKTALVSGLPDGTLILSQALPGAFNGKIVKILKH